MEIQDETATYEALLANVFYLLVIKPMEDEMCFAACSKIEIATHMLKVKAWSVWSGFKDLNATMNLVAQDFQKKGRCLSHGNTNYNINSVNQNQGR
ncbi:hypothetical protein GGI43DRAFT_416529 [Trichoderma evansii]